MSKILFYDTETSGLPLWREPSGDPAQPHIVQVAASLVDSGARHQVLAEIDLVCRCDGWEIEPDAFDLHGLTVEHCNDVGIAEITAVRALLGLWRASDFRVAHNESFDARILRIACKRYLDSVEGSMSDEWKAGEAECTQKQARPIVQAPATDAMKANNNHGIKAPTLLESYMHFHGGQPFEGQHTARGDMQACRAVYFAIQNAGAT